MIRVVLDTNILISGVLHIGKPEKLIGLAIKGELEIVSSVGVVDEFRDVIGRDKFGFSPKEQEFISRRCLSPETMYLAFPSYAAFMKISSSWSFFSYQII